MDLSKELKFIESNKLSTPVLFYNCKKMAENFNMIKETIFSKNIEIYYAMKSCYDSLLLNYISSKTNGAEIMSELEYQLAKKHNFHSIILNGMGRSYELLENVSLHKNSTIIIDSKRDLENISKILEKNSKIKNIKLGIRLNLKLNDTDYKGNNYFQTEHKLGHDITSPFCKEFLQFCTNNNRVSWDLVHTHFTINEKKPDIYQQMLLKIKQKIEEYKTLYHIAPKRIDIGGGFEIYNPKEKNIFSNLFKQIIFTFNNLFPQSNLIIEPGRFLSAYSGYVIGKILDIKNKSGKIWLITDIGTNTLIPNGNARYCLYYPQETDHGFKVGISDGITSPTNNIIYETYLKKIPEIGSYIVIGNVGAYVDVFGSFWAYNPFKIAHINENNEIKLHRSQDDIQKLKDIILK